MCRRPPASSRQRPGAPVSAWANYGPVLKAFAALDIGQQAVLQQELLALVGQFNRAGDGTMVVPGEYLEIVVTRH